jgi:hypothetical protein
VEGSYLKFRGSRPTKSFHEGSLEAIPPKFVPGFRTSRSKGFVHRENLTGKGGRETRRGKDEGKVMTEKRWKMGGIGGTDV